MESEACAIGFEVDHYDPGLLDRSDYSNLFWTCRDCNRRKGKYYCNPVTNGILDSTAAALIRVDMHRYEDHVVSDDDHRVRGTTNVGEVTVRVVGLNRALLVRLRQLRMRLGVAVDRIAGGLFTIQDLRSMTPSDKAMLESYARAKARTTLDCIESVFDLLAEIAMSDPLTANIGEEIRSSSERKAMLARQQASPVLLDSLRNEVKTTLRNDRGNRD